MEKVGAQYGLAVHWGKVQAIAVCTEQRLKAPNGDRITHSDRIIYLGSNILCQGNESNGKTTATIYTIATTATTATYATVPIH